MEDTKTRYEAVWDAALVRCREILDEDDYEALTRYQNASQLIAEIQQLETQCRESAIARLLNRIQPHLTRISVFVMFVLLNLGPSNISAACIWGSFNLLILLASDSEKTLQEIARTLSDLEHSLSLFEIYSEGVELDPNTLKSLFDILVDLVVCSTEAIKHFRKNDIENATILVSWSPIRKNFMSIFEEIARKATRLKELVEAENQKEQSQTNALVLEQLKRLNMNQSSILEDSPLPCHTLPFKRNEMFYGRVDLVKEVSGYLAKPQGKQGKQGIQTTAIWGLGGVGKSQIALEIAHRQYLAGCQIVLWIPSEKESEQASAFTKAAAQLRLPGYMPTNLPDQNRFLVVQYLQETKASWLLIFDNVEDEDALKDSKPVTGSGSILITCRSEFLAASFCGAPVEVGTFNASEGAEMLLKVLGRVSHSEKEFEYSLELSKHLGGLALAIDIIGKQIRVRKKTLEQFLPFYYEHRRLLNKIPKRARIKNEYYSKDLDTVWQTSFDRLSPSAARLIRLICFVAPDNIPESLFTEGENLPPDYTFLIDPEEWEEVKIELLDLALIAINPETSMITIHRLTREAYFDSMERQDRLEAFKIVLGLFQKPFSRPAGSNLWNRWDVCSRLIQHVQALSERYVELGATDFYSPNPELSSLFNDAAWYLVESGSFRPSIALTDLASNNCLNKHSLEYSELLDTIGTRYERQSYTPQATKYFEEMLAIVLDFWSPHDERIPGAYNAVMNGLVGMWRASEAIEYGTKAIDYGSREPDERLNYNPDRYLRNRAHAYIYTGEFENARKDLTEASYWQVLKHGPNSHFDGENALLCSKAEVAAGRLDEAYAFAERAYEFLAPGKPMHAFVATVRYRQGTIRLRQKRYGEALAHLRDALTICQFNEISNGVKSYAGATARCKWRMAQVLECQGVKEDARILRDQARFTKQELYATGLYVVREDEEESFDTLVALLFR